MLSYTCFTHQVTKRRHKPLLQELYFSSIQLLSIFKLNYLPFLADSEKKEILKLKKGLTTVQTSYLFYRFESFCVDSITIHYISAPGVCFPSKVACMHPVLSQPEVHKMCCSNNLERKEIEIV